MLATGLSGLYSSLPAKLDVSNEDWHCIQKDEWQQEPSLVHFLNSLEFCNAVMQVRVIQKKSTEEILLVYMHLQRQIRHKSQKVFTKVNTHTRCPVNFPF